VVILQKKVGGLNENALQRFVWRACRATGLKGTVNVLVASSAAVRTLNRQFRGLNKATDVLCFPSLESGSRLGGKRSHLAGEIAISGEVAAQNAARFGHRTAEEVKILALHGILHLAGFDHERDNGQMARKEMKLRERLKLPVALIERSQASESGSLRTKRSRASAGARSRA